MRWEGRRESSNIEDRRGSGGGNFGGGKGTGVLGIIILLVGAYYGVDLSGLVGTPDFSGQSSQQLETQEEQQLASLSKVVLADTETVWGQYFRQMGKTYSEPTMVLYNGVTPTACDLSFYNEMKNKLGAAGDSAFAYVIAHEVGHHVQNMLGILPQVNRAQQSSDRKTANQLSVQLELQADCFAGVWASQAVKSGLFERGDEEKAFNAAEAVGDDRLQKRSQGYVVPDSFTHGTSAQRLEWFRKGLQSANPSVCNTFNQ
ncbi:MAG: neutral zinc metallopeptidase [Haemophilus parainfluenzae]|nr:neutral zinc metallopeptidase [Haemophilus parainfluenzae]